MGDVTELFDGKPPRIKEDDSDSISECPVKAVGHYDGTYYYITPCGALRQLKDNQHKRNQIFSLFEDQSDWLSTCFPKKSRSDNRPGWDPDAVAEWLMDAAARAGLVDLEKSLRGLGVWRVHDNEIVVHVGDQILRAGKWIPAGQKIDHKLYIAQPPVDRPADEAASKETATRLFKFISNSWAWNDPEVSGQFVLGWIYCGILAGALGWRPHLWLTAGPGSGKSRLDELIIGLLGSGSEKVSDPTGAGVRGLLGVNARGVLADEVEPGDNKRAESMIELARMASTDSQGPVIRGTSDGRVQRWPIRACFMFSSILVPTFRPQDFGRITVLEVGRFPDKSPKEIADFEASFQDNLGVGPELRRRAIDGYSRFLQNKATYSAIMAMSGNTRRAADQLASLLAGAATLLYDEPVSAESGQELLGGMSVSDITGGDEIGDEIECLQHLLSTKVVVRFENGNRDYTIGELIEKSAPNPANWRQKELRRMGISVAEVFGVAYLQISNTHREIRRLYKDTRWPDQGHARVLKRLPYAQRGEGKAISFSGFKSKATWLPMADLPLDWQPVTDQTPDEI